MERFKHMSTINFKMTLSLLRRQKVRKTAVPCSQFKKFISCADSTLSHATVSTDLAGAGVCAACTFTNDSTARGCTIELHNDEYMFVFNMSRQNKLALLECIPVPEAGVFSVSVYEVLQDGSMGHKVWRLPDVTISAENTSLSVRKGKTLLYY